MNNNVNVNPMKNIRQQLEYLSWLDACQNSDPNSYITIKAQIILQKIGNHRPLTITDPYTHNVVKALNDLNVIEPINSNWRLSNDWWHPRYQFTAKGQNAIDNIPSTKMPVTHKAHGSSHTTSLLTSGLLGVLLGAIGMSFGFVMIHSMAVNIDQIEYMETPSMMPALWGVISIACMIVSSLILRSVRNALPDLSARALPITTAISERNFFKVLLAYNVIQDPIGKESTSPLDIKGVNAKVQQIINYQMFQQGA